MYNTTKKVFWPALGCVQVVRSHMHVAYGCYVQSIFLIPGHEERQKYFKALRNRQDLFQEEGILNLILDAIDKMNVITGQGILSSLAGEESGQQWNDVSAYLFQLLGNFHLWIKWTSELWMPQI